VWPVVLVLPFLLVWTSGCETRESTPAREVVVPAPAPIADGTLRVSLLGPASASPGVQHETTFVNGTGYAGFADNDIRGFLDGRFQYAWNQPLQAHVRAGRRRSSPRYGETELFRILHRWADLGLPADAEVETAELRVGVEVGLDRPLPLLLYAVHGDWDPGLGGGRRDNSSPPEPGDVWWGARAHGEQPWGLPGAGFRSDVHPGADTPTTALAEASYEPGADEVRFASPALARYVEECVREGQPVRLLFKLGDRAEDEPDTLLYFYSGEHGDIRNPARRPSLRLRWRAGSVASRERDLLLEPGSVYRTGRLPAKNAATVAASFLPREQGAGDESSPVTIEVRSGGESGEPSAWLPVLGPVRVDPDAAWVELRVLAAVQPVSLGRPFETSFRDTWLPSGPPETQDVRFTFRSPSGEVVEKRAEYRGDYVFTVSIDPRELGRWEYSFTHEFEHPYESVPGVFDVVALEHAGVVEALRALLSEAEAGEIQVGEGNVPVLGPRFWRLERALLALETPESLASPAGRERFALVTRLREVIGGRPAPERPPLKPAKREW